MKKMCKAISLILVFALCLAVPVSAEEVAPYASNYFMAHRAYLESISGSSFKVWFNVTSVSTMTTLGVNYIEIEESSDGVNWSPVKTYDKSDYSQLTANNVYYHSGYVTFNNKQSGYQYRAYVDFYAKNSSGSATYGTYAYF